MPPGVGDASRFEHRPPDVTEIAELIEGVVLSPDAWTPEHAAGYVTDAYRIAERDGWKCHVDELGYMPNDPWEVDHDVSLAKGGTNHIGNLRLCHRSCNRDKGAA